MLTREKLLELATIVREETEQGLNSAQRVGHLLYEIVSSFLSKTGDDTTNHKLTAEELQVLSVLTVAGSQLIGTDGGNVKEVISSILGSQIINGDDTVKGDSNLIGNTYFGAKFIHGLQGRGGIVSPDGEAEFDSLLLRKWLEVPEMRLNRTLYIAGDLRQSWCNGIVESVQRLSDSTGVIKLKLEDGEGGTCQKDDICIGMYQFGDGEDSTEDMDDLKGNMTRAGFTTCYFRVTNVSGRYNEVISYSLRPYTKEVTDSDTGRVEKVRTYGRHPHRFMKFAGYGNFTNKTRQESTCITKSYIQFLRGVDDWEYTFANIAMQIGELDGLMKSYKDDGCPDMTGYSAYLNNIYFNGKIAQIGDDTIEELQKKIRNYNVNFSEHVDVVTVDDVGNVVGGLYSEDIDGNGNPYRLYRIHSAITVRNNNKILTVCADNETADAGTYKLYAQPHGCSCLIKDSTLYITAIDNIKDGIAGTVDDSSFDYDKMRQMESCSVDILVDCEGRATITKSFPITIKHQSEPFIGADITNENSAVSWNTKSRSFIGLPIVVDMKMWHNNTLLDVSKICVKTDSGKLISSSDKKDSVTIVPGLKVKSTIAQTAGVVTESGKIGHIEITSVPDNIASITNLSIIGEAVYAGVKYERTFTHTIRKSADVNVYQLVPSADQILTKFKDGTRVVDIESITCAVHCDSSDDKHYILTEEDVNAAGLTIQYSVDNGATKKNYGSAIQINTDISSVIFYLIQGDFIWDQETVPIILDGVDGKGVEFIFFLQDSWKEDSDNPAAMDAPTILDESSKKEFQVENFCPYNIKKTDRWTDEPSGVGMNHRYEFYSMRKKVNGVWQPFSPVKLWNKYTVDGKSNYVLDLTNEQSFLNCDDKGTVLSSYEDTTIQLFKGTEYAWALFDINIVAHNISYSYVPESHIIQPSNITADNASIVVTATLKANHDIVLTTVYKIYKSYAGKGGVVYSLMPSVNTIHLMANGDYIDKVISMQVKKIVGETTTILTTFEELNNDNLTLNYLLNDNGFGIPNPTSISSEAVCNTNSYATFLLMKDGNVVDRQRINCVSDGESGKRGDKGNNGCIQRVWQTFIEGQVYRNDTKAEETETDSLNYLDFVAVPDSSMTSGWKVYQCVATHTSGKQAELSDTKLWKELSINAQSAFFTFLIAKNANVQILSSAQLTITGEDGKAVAGLGNTNIPLWVGSEEPSKSPFYVTRKGELHATGAVIQGDINARKGKIGPFSIGEDGIYVGDYSKWWSSEKTNFAYLNSSSLLLEQQVGYFSAGDIAHMMIGLGRGSDPTSKDESDAYCASAMYIYRKMNAFSDTYRPAVQIISDNVVNRDIALHIQGGLRVTGGIIEYGRYMEYNREGDTNVFDLSFGTTFYINNKSSDKIMFFYPKLSDVRKQLGIKNTNQAFCVPITVVVDKNSNTIVLASQCKARTPVSEEEGGKIMGVGVIASSITFNKERWEYQRRNDENSKSKVYMQGGVVGRFALCYNPSSGYYCELLSSF